jgi:Zn-finger domain-containing protein
MTHEEFTILEDVTRALRSNQIALAALAEQLDDAKKSVMAGYAREKIAANWKIIDRATAAMTEAAEREVAA